MAQITFRLSSPEIGQTGPHPANPVVIPEDGIAPPGWVAGLFHGAPCQSLKHRAAHIDLRRSGPTALLSTRIPDAVELSACDLSVAVEAAYSAIHSQLDAIAGFRAVRFWNYIPYIHTLLEPGVVRYMAFNAGRFAAMKRWGHDADFAFGLPTASAIGHFGRDLHIDCIATAAASRHIENPRQTPAYRYSAKYGRLPPCFSRGTVTSLPGWSQPVLLIGGTASVVGEDSWHVGSLRLQVEETLRNLLYVASAGMTDLNNTLGVALRSIRIYHPRAEDASEIGTIVRQRLPAVGHVEFLRADICRPELLVEIEGLAAHVDERSDPWPRDPQG